VPMTRASKIAAATLLISRPGILRRGART
jgi:hypothetical protein